MIQSFHGEFDTLEISELTGHTDSNPKAQQRRMSNKLAGFSLPSTTCTTSTSTSIASTPPVVALREVTNLSSVQSSIAPNVTVNTPSSDDSSFSGFLTGAVEGLFTGATFNNSPVSVNINLQSRVNGL